VSTTVMDFVAVPPRCIYACAVVCFFDATVFSVNKDLCHIMSPVQNAEGGHIRSEFTSCTPDFRVI